MHLRNKYYNNVPDFVKLANLYPSLKKYIKYNRRSHSRVGTINFKDPRACRELTYALLWCDFNIRLEIPLDSLCPIIPGRLDYIHWIEDLILNKKNNSNNNKDDVIFTNENNTSHDNILDFQIKGIDIGTGASCIYPLLACRLHPKWKMEALELNERSYEYAKDNIERNNLKSQITIRKVKNEQQIQQQQGHSSSSSSCNALAFLSKKIKKKDSIFVFTKAALNSEPQNDKVNYNKLMSLLIAPDYDFCMCNPPFYSSESEMEQCKDFKVEEPHSVCTGSSFEMLTDGGEVQFITGIINDSIEQYKRRKKSVKKLYKLFLTTKSCNLLKRQLILKNNNNKERKSLKKGLIVRWYTSLIGKKSSMEPLINYLKSQKYVKEVKTTNFKQGKTVRWAIAWSLKTIKYPSL
ncbi:S-adenosyl-L-methionine dependent methyltransferase [Neocallimastix sp. 'constans']